MRHLWKISGKQLQKECNFVVIVITICNWKLQIFFILTIEHDIVPSDEFEPTHCQLTVNSQDELTLWAYCEISVTLQLAQWACIELFVRSSRWAHCVVVAVNSVGELQSYIMLTESSQHELILWVHCELTECPQNEPTMRLIQVSSMRVWC